MIIQFKSYSILIISWALTFDLLKHAIEGTPIVCYSSYEACMFQAAMVLAFYAFLRVSEFTEASANRPLGRVSVICILHSAFRILHSAFC